MHFRGIPLIYILPDYSTNKINTHLIVINLLSIYVVIVPSAKDFLFSRFPIASLFRLQVLNQSSQNSTDPTMDQVFV